jgi:pimeloyl-ACP methyl ester carboxylesterase
MEAARRLTTADGTGLAYWLWQPGAERRRLLVLIHGAASNHTRWSEFLEHTELKESWDVLRPDMRGNGESMVRGRLDTEIWSRDLAEILEIEGYPSGLVIGHSLGAQIAIHFAARYPSQADGLVLIDPVFRRALIGKQRRISRARPLFLLAIWVARALNSLGIYRRQIPNRDLKVLDQETRKELQTARSKAAPSGRSCGTCRRPTISSSWSKPSDRFPIWPRSTARFSCSSPPASLLPTPRSTSRRSRASRGSRSSPSRPTTGR